MPSDISVHVRTSSLNPNDPNTTPAMSPSTNTSDAAVESPTTFLDLPPELRNRIYELAINNIPARSPVILNYLRLPALARVSHQIRQEFIPLYLSTTPITIIIGANPEVRAVKLRKENYTPNKYTNHRERLDQVTQDSGRIVLPRITFPQGCLFRHVHFNIIHGDLTRTKNMRGEWNESGWFWTPTICTLLLSYTPKERSSVKGRLERGFRLGWQYEREDIHALLELAVGTAERIAKREGFKGFSLSDLDSVAARFRYED